MNDSEAAEAIMWSVKSDWPRIAFISPRVFGMMGTQGSYGLAEAFSLVVPTLVISRKYMDNLGLPIVAEDKGIENHRQVNFSSRMVKYEIGSLIEHFRPDIVHFVNDRSWVHLVPFLKNCFPSCRFVMDFKSPLLAKGSSRDFLQIEGRQKAHKLDLVLALSVAIARSWLPNYNGPLLNYPLGIDVSLFSPRTRPMLLDRGCVRFVYIGQIHPKRNMLKLFQLIASLESSVKSCIIIDIYGAGLGEQEFDEHIESFGLVDIVTRKTPLPQEELFALLPTYDCGIAWVPRKLYNEAPSLKFLEYAAARIGIIASDTIAHRQNVAGGFQAILFEENIESFSNAIKEVMSGQITSEMIENNRKVVQCHDFRFIVRNLILPEYGKLLESKTKSKRSNPPIRMLFVTPRSLGLIATSGTYLNIEAYAEHCDVQVIAKPRNSENEIIVHEMRSSVPVTLLDPEQLDYIERFKAIVKSFEPDIICLGQFLDWHVLTSQLKKAFPSTAQILEVKSPVTLKDKQRLGHYRTQWQEAHRLLDGIIAPSQGMANSYVEKIERPFLQHRNVIDFWGIRKKVIECSRIICRKFVFSGSLARRRKLNNLIQLIGALPNDLLDAIHLDIYGEGGAKEELEALIRELDLERTIHFMGTVPQRELFRRYRYYDGGIAWVPRAPYDSAPSLKLIEYCASGITPIATSSRGQLLLKTCGFSIDFFEEEKPESFIGVMRKLCVNGVDSQRLEKNMEQAEKFHFRNVGFDEILPFYHKILEAKKAGRTLSESFFSTPQLIGDINICDDPLLAWAKQVDRDAKKDLCSTVLSEGIAYERALHARRMQARVFEQ